MHRILFIILLLFLTEINAQVPFGVAPLKKGNIWVYSDITSPIKTLRIVYEVMDSSVILNNHQYSVIKGYEISALNDPRHISYYNSYCRYDSTEGIYKYYDNYGRFKYSDYTYYKRGCVSGELWKTKEPEYNNRTAYNMVMDTATLNIFPKAVFLTKYISVTDSNLTNTAEYWTDEIGLIKRVDEGAMYFLEGCVINGVLYGDTTRTLTGVIDEKGEFPQAFCLYQNYPNPFNSSTKFEYQIISTSLIKLEIYDVLGNKINTLVNTIQSPGHYSVLWDANKGNLPSGIYFSVLKQNDIPTIKKLIYLK